MSGLELARRFEATRQRSSSAPDGDGNGGSEDVVRALRSGFGGYIVKPFSEDTLAQHLATLLHIDIAPRRDVAPMIPANWTEWLAAEGWARTDLRAIPPPPRSFREVFSVAGRVMSTPVA
jgi:DNA-binding NarL/FixJ family response regulator